MRTAAVGTIRRSLWLIWACLVLLAAPGFADETRLALVIDQTNYQNASELSRVAGAGHEADLIESALRDTGFDVTRVSNRTRTQLVNALDDFRIHLEQAGPEAVGFVYYTGHGAQHPQTHSSFLLGIDARLRAASDLAAYGIDLEAQRDGFAATGAKAVFLVFDACRNVVAGSGFKANVKGMSRIEAGADMLIAYSTGLDDVAQEGIYAPVLAEEIRQQGQPAETVFANVQKRVAQKTGFRQKPWFNPQLYQSVCFAGCQAPATSAAPLLASDEGTALAQAISANTPAAYEEFQDRFPNSANLAFVEAKIAQLTPRPASSTADGIEFRDAFVSGTNAGPLMVLLPLGNFQMGSPADEEGRDSDEGPQRTVTIKYHLAVGKYEVTWAEWEVCISDGACPPLADDNMGKGTHPVTNLSWDDAKAYASWLSEKTGRPYRLLSEAEWEYAARARTTTPYSFGSDPESGCAYMNGADATLHRVRPRTNDLACDDGYANTARVGSFLPNDFGLHDMHGNVMEWVDDCYEESYRGKPIDGSAFQKPSCSKRVYRGGSWHQGAKSLRSADRISNSATVTGSTIGFRVATTIP
ncbi:MAG TPA: SUMF1/EgtB/PvdO family nonheme iron enzyme [Hyphomonas sp.]|nr:SUMF1/EgtB/PvdO family nonheme iron enzyme [Hyphomonas sp.]MCB9972883.1 SUMF1/EgtB/PvdO family nonheme iron enzyme [Hyphomonas sp.]HPE47342.1 SUMF1/EgtB/PvdO family nonheme iron enzyme [Hyphomonas sp.]